VDYTNTGDSNLLRKVGAGMPSYTASYAKRLSYSSALMSVSFCTNSETFCCRHL